MEEIVRFAINVVKYTSMMLFVKTNTRYSHRRLPFTVMVDIKVLKRSRAESSLTQRRFFRKTARGKVVKGATVISLFFSLAQTI